MKISTFNIFENPQTIESEQTQYRGQIATRIYFVTFGVILFILIFYSLFSLRLQIVTVQWPSEEEFEHLQSLYPSTLKCPCSQISIPYNVLILINPKYHPICSSQFISQEWIDSILQGDWLSYWMLYETNDFHISGPSQMILLQRFCEMVSTTVNDSWNIFTKQQYISSLALSRDLFFDEVESIFEQFKMNTINSFKNLLDLVGMFVQGNQLLLDDSISMELTLSYSMETRFVNIEFEPWIDSNKTECSCALTSTCRSQLAYYLYSFNAPPNNSVLVYTFPTFYLGCTPVNSFLQSTFNCFFDQACIDIIIYNTLNPPWSDIPISSALPSVNISILNASDTRFDPSSIILDIISQLMIEEWEPSINFTQYYSTCRPISCTYSYQQRFDILYILTTILALFGGLNTTLLLIIPFGVKIIKRRKLNFKILFDHQLNVFFNKLKKTVITWNLFPNTQTHIDEVIKHRQQITTRFYVFFLVCTLLILTLCRSLSSELISQSINNPSIDEIEQLEKEHKLFDCPCTNISIPYSKFVTIKSRLHPICSSDFVSNEWQEKLYENGSFNSYTTYDFRRSAFAQFQLLSLLCELTNISFYDSLNIFETSTLITYNILSIESFNSTINKTIEQFRRTTSRQFSLTLEFIRNIMYGNGIHSALQTNSKYSVFDTKYYPPLFSNPISYGENCTCGTSPLCSQPAQIFLNTNDTDEYLLIPGMKVGCYPLESLLQSTLECFYQQTCIDLIETNINPSYQLNLTSLDNDNNIDNNTIQMLLQNLFIVEWKILINYNDYFDSCKLRSCSYSYLHRLDLLYVFTTLLALYGGIVVILRAIVPLGVQMMFKCQHYLYYRQRVEQISSLPNDNEHEKDLSVI